ncbi:MAG: response regulator [Kiloniellales bacterium]|nr:response regulator [Kiloniellales bacterium]
MARILLVDDEPQLLLVMEQALSEASHEVTAVSDARKVLAGLVGADFDLLVTDMLMPRVDGLEVIAHLRRHNPEIGVIAISGGGHLPSSFHLKLASQSGALAALEKPFSLDRLVETARDLLGQASRREPAAALPVAEPVPAGE